LTPPTDAPDARRLTRIPILVGASIAALCAGGAAVATAQTTTATDDPEGAETTSAAEDEAAAAEETGGTQGSAEESGAAEEERLQARRAPTRLKRTRVKPAKLFLRSGRKAEFVFELGGGDAKVRVKAVKKGSGRVVKRWRLGQVQANQRERIGWNGSVKGGGKAPKGRYRFRVESAGGNSLARGKVDGKRALGIYPAKFPVRGRHQYWDGWGAGRGHQGQDVGARCGTKMVAAQAGRVAYRGFDGGGYGHYLAINVRGSNRAHIYAHMKGKARVRRGKRVRTGQTIGRVGESGNASGCHLHFEYWRGSWGGGHATTKATRKLRKWDRWS
jgi:murein DD-endopeptidase MepM/ murein hydrolase activator NlpD